MAASKLSKLARSEHKHVGQLASCAVAPPSACGATAPVAQPATAVPPAALARAAPSTHTAPYRTRLPELQQEGVEVGPVPLLLPRVLLHPKVEQARGGSALHAKGFTGVTKWGRTVRADGKPDAAAACEQSACWCTRALQAQADASQSVSRSDLPLPQICPRSAPTCRCPHLAAVHSNHCAVVDARCRLLGGVEPQLELRGTQTRGHGQFVAASSSCVARARF